MGSALSLLKKGRKQLESEFKTSYTYKGTSFIGVAATATAADTLSNSGSRDFSQEHKFRIGVDPTQSAFASGLPKASELILQGSDRYMVVEVEHSPGQHIAYISVK
jgi:hypothetical protein